MFPKLSIKILETDNLTHLRIKAGSSQRKSEYERNEEKKYSGEESGKQREMERKEEENVKLSLQ